MTNLQFEVHRLHQLVHQRVEIVGQDGLRAAFTEVHQGCTCVGLHTGKARVFKDRQKFGNNGSMELLLENLKQKQNKLIRLAEIRLQCVTQNEKSMVLVSLRRSCAIYEFKVAFA